MDEMSVASQEDGRVFMSNRGNPNIVCRNGSGLFLKECEELPVDFSRSPGHVCDPRLRFGEEFLQSSPILGMPFSLAKTME